MASDVETIERRENYFPTQAFSLNFHSARLTDEQFEELCRNNRDLKFELTSTGELIIVPPTSPESGWRNSDLVIDIGNWSRKDKTGIVLLTKETWKDSWVLIVVDPTQLTVGSGAISVLN